MIYYSKRKMAVYKLVLCRKKALLRSPIVQKKPHCVKFNVPGNSEFRSTTNSTRRETASFYEERQRKPQNKCRQ